MNSFQTRSNPQKYMLTVILTFIPLFALAFLGLKIAVITWLFFEGILALCFCFCLFLVVRSYWEIEIKDNCIYLYNTGNRQSYYVDELTQSDLIIKQNDTQKRKNLCDLRIKNTSFRFYDVANHDEMIAFIQENISNEKK